MQGLFWENISLRSWWCRLSAVRSVQKDWYRANILPVQSQVRLVNNWFISCLEWTFLEKNAMIMDWKNIAKIQVHNPGWEDLRYTRVWCATKQKGKKVWKEKKKNLLCKSDSFQKLKSENYQKILNSDYAGSFRTVPGPILREYWASNTDMWLVDFHIGPLN